MKALFYALFFSVFSILALTTGQTGHADQQLGLPALDVPKEYEQKGSLIDIRIVPGAKETRLYLVGKETAKIKITDYKVKASMSIGGTEKQVEFLRSKNYFQTTTQLHGDLNLKLESVPTKKTEEFRIKLKKD